MIGLHQKNAPIENTFPEGTFSILLIIGNGVVCIVNDHIL